MQPAFPNSRAATGGGLLARLKPSTESSRVLRALWPYVWPHDRPDLKRTVVWSLVFVIIAKIVTVGVPFTLKWATDALVAVTGGHVPASQSVPWLIGAPVLACIFYGLARIVMSLLVQVREGMFARVAMHAVRKLALTTFEHMHRLSMRFHLERKTGGLTRVLERGRTGIENISRMALMTLIPTIVEFFMIIVVCAIEFDWRYIATIVGMIVCYLWFTVRATEWRLSIRRAMNESDTDANTKAVDSLLNYETVKYFGAEDREAQRYDKSMALYERASIKTYTSLAVLNSGQAVIFTIALTICLVMAANDVLAGTGTVGQFVMVNLLMLQLFMPLNFMGMVYREIKQGLTDIERMMEVLDRESGGFATGPARPISAWPAAPSASITSAFPTIPSGEILEGRFVRGAGRQDGRDRRPVGRRQVDGQPAAAALLRRDERQNHDRRTGHPRRHAGSPARRDRRRAAGHGAVQRHDLLQHQLRPRRCDRRRGRRRRKDGADRRLRRGRCPTATTRWSASAG